MAALLPGRGPWSQRLCRRRRVGYRPRMSDLAPRSRAAFHALLDLLREVGDTHFSLQRGVIDETTAAEGYRLLTHCWPPAPSTISRAIRSGRCSPRIVSPSRKVLGDNPDALYYWTRIDGRRARTRCAARSTARSTRRSPCTASIPAAAAMERVISDVNDTGLAVAADGTYELIALARAAAAATGSALKPDATSVITRHYFERPLIDRGGPIAGVRLRIDPLDPPKPAAAMDATRPSRRACEAVTRYLRANTLGMPRAGARPELAVRVARARTCCRSRRASAPRASTRSARSTSTTRWRPICCSPISALVMEGRLPACRFANVDAAGTCTCRRSSTAFRRTSLNRAQMQLRAGRLVPRRRRVTVIPVCRTGSIPKATVSGSCSGGFCCRRRSPARSRVPWKRGDAALSRRRRRSAASPSARALESRR